MEITVCWNLCNDRQWNSNIYGFVVLFEMVKIDVKMTNGGGINNKLGSDLGPYESLQHQKGRFHDDHRNSTVFSCLLNFWGTYGFSASDKSLLTNGATDSFGDVPGKHNNGCSISSARLQYLHDISHGDTIVLHYTIDIALPSMQAKTQTLSMLWDGPSQSGRNIYDYCRQRYYHVWS